MALDDNAKDIHNLKYLSPEFLDDVKFANETARGLGASEPACSSVRAKAASFSPLARGGSHRACWSGVPKRTSARRPIE